VLEVYLLMFFNTEIYHLVIYNLPLDILWYTHNSTEFDNLYVFRIKFKNVILQIKNFELKIKKQLIQ